MFSVATYSVRNNGLEKCRRTLRAGAKISPRSRATVRATVRKESHGRLEGPKFVNSSLQPSSCHDHDQHLFMLGYGAYDGDFEAPENP